MGTGYTVWILAVTVAALSTACNFPALKQTATPTPAATIIRGVLWHDVCDAVEGLPEGSCQSNGSGGYVGNGRREGGEPGIGGVKVDFGSGACPSSALDSTTTSADGSYAFVGHEAGVYCVSIDSESDDNLRQLLPGIWTHPEGAMHTVETTGGEDHSGVDFGWDFLMLPAAEPSVHQSGAPHVTAVTDTNCRSGPGTVYEVVGSLLEGESALVYGRDQEGVWWWVQLPMRLDDCWVTDVTVNINFSPDDLPYVAAPPTPIPTPGSIGGRIWHDECGSTEGAPASGCVEVEDGGYQADGLRQPDELGIGGVLVMLGEGTCPSTGSAATITEDDGSYVFKALAEGNYCVSVDVTGAVNSSILIPGVWTNPPSEAVADKTVTIGPAEEYLVADFGWDYQFLP